LPRLGRAAFATFDRFGRGEVPVSAGATARRGVLQETALQVGQRWFASTRDDLLRDGRHIEGGWPGTMPEARALVAASLPTALVRRRMPTATNEELALAVRAAYDEAKRAWLTSPERSEGSEVVP
jgi:hypothetical protein